MAPGAAADRAERMARRIAVEVRSAGIDEASARAPAAAARAALEHRAERVVDEHDPRLLHPARSLLVLLRDTGVRDGSVLAAAPLLDSRFPELALPAERRPAAAAEEPGRIVDGLPLPSWPSAAAAPDPPASPRVADPRTADPRIVDPRIVDDARLLEELVALPSDVVLLVLAEALDQLRHLHMEVETEPLRRGLELARKVYFPVAVRTGGTLVRRYAWWERTFSRMEKPRGGG